MRRTSTGTFVAIGVLALIAIGPVFMPWTFTLTRIEAAGERDRLVVTGVIRDFSRSHPDFDVVPAEGFGHCAGNVGLTLPGDGRPVLTPGAGYLVNAQWTDSAARNIAPHLYTSAGRTVYLATAPTFTNNPTVDSFDYCKGPYGGPNVGPAPDFQTGAEMPILTEPTELPWTADVVYDGNGSSTRSESIHCDRFEVKNSHVLRIDGKVVVLCDELFTVANQAQIELLPGASLELYVRNICKFQENTRANANTADPTRFAVYNLGTERILLENSAALHATIVSPRGELLIANTADFFGWFTGESLRVQNYGGYHHARCATDACGNEVADVAGARGLASDAGATSADTFGQWFRDAPGVNASARHLITLRRDGAGVWSYLDDAFYPIDDRLLGNDGDDHNLFFTYAIAVDFVHHECREHFIQFQGGDGAWIFVGGRLAIDLGGVGSGVDQYVFLDRLRLVDGETYSLHLFYAHRDPASSVFRLRTSLDLIRSSAPPTVSGMYD